MTFFARPTPAQGEPLYGGFLVRLCEENALPTMQWLFDLLREKAGVNVRTSLELVTNQLALAFLEQELAVAPGTLAERAWFRYPQVFDTWYRIDSKSWDDVHLMIRAAQVCPRCLKERPQARSTWLWGHLPVCATHGLALLEACPECGRRLSNDRTAVCNCASCGYDLRQAWTPEISPSARNLASMTIAGQKALVGTADEAEPLHIRDMAVLVSLMASAVAHRGAIPEHSERLDAHAVTVRTKAFEALACAWDGERLLSSALREFFLGHWPYLADTAPALRVWRIEQLFEARFIPVRLGNLVLYGVADRQLRWAVHRLGDAAPYLQNEPDVAHYVGLSTGELSDLVRTSGYLKKSADDWCYDADELLTVREMVAEMRSREQLDDILGFAGLSDVLERHGMLKPWSAAAAPTRRFSAWSAAALLDRLWEAVQSDPPSSDPISLGEVIGRYRLDAAGLGQLLALVANGGLIPKGWPSPYRVTDLVFDGASIAKALEGPLLREFSASEPSIEHDVGTGSLTPTGAPPSPRELDVVAPLVTGRRDEP